MQRRCGSFKITHREKRMILARRGIKKVQTRGAEALKLAQKINVAAKSYQVKVDTDNNWKEGFMKLTLNSAYNLKLLPFAINSSADFILSRAIGKDAGVSLERVKWGRPKLISNGRILIGTVNLGAKYGTITIKGMETLGGSIMDIIIPYSLEG